MNLKEILKKFTINEIIYFEENFDKQFLAIKNLRKNLNNDDLFVKLVILNSIVSYQLIEPGEKYWLDFSNFFSQNNQNVLQSFKIFLEKFNPINKESKLKRIEKVYLWIKDKNLIEDYKQNLKKFNKDLAFILKQKENDKTICFATKMFGYSLRVIGFKIIFPFEIFIPIDKRIGKISKDLNFWINLSKEIKTFIKYRLFNMDNFWFKI